MVGMMYSDGTGIDQDYKKAFEWTEKSAKQGLGKAQWMLGLMYYKGLGVELDRKKAAYWVKKSKKNGCKKAKRTWEGLELWKYE